MDSTDAFVVTRWRTGEVRRWPAAEVWVTVTVKLHVPVLAEVSVAVAD